MEKIRVMSGREPCSTPPKLSFYSLPIHRPDNPGTATPPLRLPVSIPYNWEEAPGKPKNNSATRRPFPKNNSAEQVRRLELPPRMLAAMLGTTEDAKSKTIAVAHGRSSPLGSCYSFSFSEGRSTKKERVVWRPWSKAKSSPNERKMSLEEGVKMDSCESSSSSNCSCSCSCSSSSSTSDASSVFNQSNGDQEVANNMDQNKSNVRILRLRRNRSLASVTTTRMWASIYNSMKQVVSWS